MAWLHDFFRVALDHFAAVSFDGKADRNSSARVREDIVKHYLRFSNGAADHARHVFVFSGDALQSAFDDLTAHGQRISFSHRAPTETGPCIELRGRRCHALAGRDTRQIGVLFIFNLRERPFSTTETNDYVAQFDLWNATAVPADSVEVLFSASPAPTTPPARPRYVASSELQQFFATVPQSVRGLYWPRAPLLGPALLHVSSASRTWRKHGLDTLPLPTRGSWQEAILRGSASLSPSQQNMAGIWPLFDLVLLDRFVSSVRDAPASDTRFHALLEDIGALPLPETQRSRFWFHMIAQRDADSLVHDVASFANTISSLESSEQETWGRAVDDAVREVGRRSSRHEALHILKGRLDLADTHDLPFREVLSDWAALVGAHGDSVEQVAAPPAIETVLPTVSRERSLERPATTLDTTPSASASVEEWILATLGSDRETVRSLREESDDLRERLKNATEISAPSLLLLRLSEVLASTPAEA